MLSGAACRLSFCTLTYRKRIIKNFMSLRALLSCLMILLAVIGLGSLVENWHRHRALLVEYSLSQAEVISENLVVNQQQIIAYTKEFLRGLSRQPSVRDPAGEACGRFLSDILPLTPNFVNLGVPLPNGDLRCNALPLPPRRINVFDRPYFQRSLTLK